MKYALGVGVLQMADDVREEILDHVTLYLSLGLCNIRDHWGLCV